MPRTKGSKNKPKVQQPVVPDLPGYLADPAGKMLFRASKSTRANMQQLKASMGVKNLDDVLERVVAIAIAIQAAART